MDLNELMKRQKELNEKLQNDFIDKIKSDVDFLKEKYERQDYVPTQHEKQVIGEITNAMYDIVRYILNKAVKGEN